MIWQTFNIEFNSGGFTGTVNDGRLRFWLAPFVTPGDIYYIDDIRLEKASSSDLPTITMHPSNRTVNIGQNATFTVSATGTAPLGYQWKKNGVNIAGATNASYTTPSSILSDNGSTFVVNVTNIAGSVLGNPAILTVLSLPVAPNITMHPSNRTVNIGQNATFTVSATGTAPLSYQWKKNGVNIAGATNASYTTPSSILSDNGSTFVVNVTNSRGSIMSKNATLTVLVATSINLIKNPGFESGTTSWLFYTSGSGTFTAASPGIEGTKSANLIINSEGTNIQLYQTGITLEPNTRYRLSFAAYSTTGHDVTVRLFKHVSPFTEYMPDFEVNLANSWQTFTTEFTTTGFSGTVNDGRLMLWLAPFSVVGDRYYFDDIRLEKV